MTNAIAKLVEVGLDAASSDWRISAGIICAGVALAAGKWIWDKRKAKRGVQV